MAGKRRQGTSWSAISPGARSIWLVRVLGAYVLLQFTWWAYLLASRGGESERWMVLGEGSVFAALLILGLIRLERNFRQERLRLARERNLLLGVTHELKTPLASVQLGVDSLRRLELSERDRDAVLENMQNGVQDLGHRVEEMLVATRLQRQTDVQATSFDWGDMLEEAVGRVSDSQRHRIAVHRPEMPQEVRGDRALWVLSASNLIENALKYSEGNVEVHATLNDTDALLEVSDQGEGIPKADRELAKSPFVRLHEEGSGTGLGLHLVSQTALLHGAQMDMVDLDPRGFAVRLVWPQER